MQSLEALASLEEPLHWLTDSPSNDFSNHLIYIWDIYQMYWHNFGENALRQLYLHIHHIYLQPHPLQYIVYMYISLHKDSSHLYYVEVGKY